MSKMSMSIIITFLLSSVLFGQPRDSIIRVGACATPGWADGVYVQGQYAYIADRGGVTSIDISDPSAPDVVDYLREPDCQATGIFVVDTLAYANSALCGPTFTILNVADPSTMTRISSELTPCYGGNEPRGIYVRDSLGYFADSDGGFLIIDITDLLNPTALCTLETPGRVIDLFVRDTIAYLADQYSLLIVNVKDPYNPTIIGSLSIDGWGVYDVCVSGDYAFVTEENYWGGYGNVNMVNVSDPTSPFIVDQVSMPGTPYGLFVVDDKIYVAADDWWNPQRSEGEGRADIEGGIRIVQWESPGTMQLLDNTYTPGRCRDIFVVDSFVYVTVVDSFMIYKYRSTGVVENDKGVVLPPSLVVSPNPFYNNAQISFTIPNKLSASIEIYDRQGRKIKDLAGGCFTSGHYDVVWDGTDNNESDVAAGVYYIKLSTKSGAVRGTQQEKIIYIK